jgi:hypothetical protein
MTIVRRPSDGTDGESSNYGQSNTDRGLFRGVEIRNLAGFPRSAARQQPVCLLELCMGGNTGCKISRLISPCPVALKGPRRS